MLKKLSKDNMDNVDQLSIDESVNLKNFAKSKTDSIFHIRSEFVPVSKELRDKYLDGTPKELQPYCNYYYDRKNNIIVCAIEDINPDYNH